MTQQKSSIPFKTYPNRIVGFRSEGAQFRGVVSCSMRGTGDVLREDFFCDKLRDTSDDAIGDARDLMAQKEQASD